MIGGCQRSRIPVDPVLVGSHAAPKVLSGPGLTTLHQKPHGVDPSLATPLPVRIGLLFLWVIQKQGSSQEGRSGQPCFPSCVTSFTQATVEREELGSREVPKQTCLFGARLTPWEPRHKLTWSRPLHCLCLSFLSPPPWSSLPSFPSLPFL